MFLSTCTLSECHLKALDELAAEVLVLLDGEGDVEDDGALRPPQALHPAVIQQVLTETNNGYPVLMRS